MKTNLMMERKKNQKWKMQVISLVQNDGQLLLEIMYVVLWFVVNNWMKMALTTDTRACWAVGVYIELEMNDVCAIYI